MAKMTMSPLLLAGFPAMKQKGPKEKVTKRGERPPSETEQQNGETANAEAPKRLRNDKPKQMAHSSKAMLAPPYSMNTAEMGKPAKKVSPREVVQHEAHNTKVQATRRWMAGEMSTKDHDAAHRRADAVLKHKGHRP